MMEFGVQAALSIFIHLVILVLTWWAVQCVKWDVWLRQPKGIRAKILMILVTIAISEPVATFIVNYLSWSVQLPQIYK
ncbi:DUF1146 family protein [Pullulanibacillus sp. KACC 23026]|uniref:DUF1146 family protein n=1 Tax=Pullulanibacillus sp. KACC 23026 TaxID=3028315 RepID=UPI0023AFA3F1|nr:DUF1146 family protein [Pullulanibacillus sp. KACC 23026]WEG13116.1 DUF1146 family protein [Pullulanibacillus sp. KACC 23026]